MAQSTPEINPSNPSIDENIRNTRKSRTRPLTRSDVKGTLTRLINDLRDKATNGRIRDPDTERHRRESARLVIYACSVYLSALKDDELEKIEERLMKLESGGIK